MNKILIAVLIAVAVIFLLKKKADAPSIPENDDSNREPQPEMKPFGSLRNDPEQPSKNGNQTGEDPIIVAPQDGPAPKSFIEQKNVDELSLKNLIDWFLANKDTISHKKGAYRGIIIKDEGKAKYKQFSYRGNSNKPALNRVLVGFFNEKDEIDEEQPITIFNSKSIAEDLRLQFGNNDLIILT